MVTVTADDDAIAEGPHSDTIGHTASSDDVNYDGSAIADVTADIADNDTAGVLVSPTTLNLAEGASGEYSVVLLAEPTSDVTIDIATDHGFVNVVPVSLLFIAAEWDHALTVTVMAVDDAIAEGPHSDTIGHSASSDDVNYDEIIIASVTANITDNDTAGVLVSPTTLSLAEGASGPYTVVLLREPTSDVTITVTPAVGLTTDKGPLIFTSGNWDSAQTVTVTATPDTVYTGPRTLAVTHAASGDNYSSVSVASVLVSVADDEHAPVVHEEDKCCSPPGLRGPWLLFGDLVNHWAHEEATLAANLRIIPANDKGLWVPSGLVTRAEFITWLNRAAGFPWRNARVTFKDVKPSDAFYRDLQTAVTVGTALGYPDGNFRPGERITREEAGAMVAKALVHCGRSPVESDLMARLLLEAFRDGKDVSRVFLRDVALVVYHDIMLGHAPKTLAPKADLTRAEAAEMLVRFWRMIRMR